MIALKCFRLGVWKDGKEVESVSVFARDKVSAYKSKQMKKTLASFKRLGCQIKVEEIGK